MPKAIRIIAFVVGGLVVLMLVAVAVVVGQSNTRLAQTYDIGDVAVPDIPTSAEDLQEGQRLFQVYGCAECHGPDGGGQVFIDDPALGMIVAQNLTSGEEGVGQFYTTEDYVRAIRHGVRPDGRGILIMPSEEWIGMSSEDMGRLVAYIESLEPVDSELPETTYGAIGRVLTATGAIQPAAGTIDHDQPHPASIDRSIASLELGEYIIVNCTSCHGEDYSGGPITGAPSSAPIASNITSHESGLSDWTYEAFEMAMRQGITPEGNALDPQWMPWPAYTAFTEQELESLWLALQEAEPVDTSDS